MAIQFRCPGCSQPIEVDDIHAGQTAACPYCRRVVNVPTESALDQPAPTAARPSAGIPGGYAGAGPGLPASREAGTFPPPPPTPGELHVGPVLSYRDRAARTWGNYALIVSALSVLLFGVATTYSFTQVVPELMKSPGSQLSPEQMEELEAKLNANPWTMWMGVVSLCAIVLAVGGLALGITSLVQSRRNNWRGIVSVVVCGLCMLCICAGGAMALLTGGVAGPA